MMADAVYVLCAVTSLCCAVLLMRSWWTSKRRLLMWSGLCFVGLMLNNVFLVVDKIVFPAADLSLFTKLPAVVGLALFVFGLIWEGE